MYDGLGGGGLWRAGASRRPRQDLRSVPNTNWLLMPAAELKTNTAGPSSLGGARKSIISAGQLLRLFCLFTQLEKNCLRKSYDWAEY